MENNIHNLTIENKSRINLTNVLEVLAFSDKEIKIKLKDNTVLVVFGSALKITCFDNKNGNFIAQGVIESVKYKPKEENVLKKVFK